MVIGAQSCAAFPRMLPAMALNLTEIRIRHVETDDHSIPRPKHR